MKSLLAAILLVGFVGLAVFGFAEMIAPNGHGGLDHRTCLASAVQNTDCPKEIGDWGTAFFHIAAFKFFSTFTLETTVSLSILLALITAALLLISFFELSLVRASIPTNFYHQSNRSKFNPTSNLQPFLRWLALKESSPTR
ncbi:MAG: hypothetical protein HYT47_02495 [Candidatus Vogelbacteria bacterium]|nr:hypothetical protein [Candidatus Vogelbacteria bacterium]